jgi:hypothetical protein
MFLFFIHVKKNRRYDVTVKWINFTNESKAFITLGKYLTFITQILK